MAGETARVAPNVVMIWAYCRTPTSRYPTLTICASTSLGRWVTYDLRWTGRDDMPTFGSLFAGIGGIDLGLERAGWTGRWQVEYEPFCQRVLAKHWPDVHRVGDVHDAHGAAYCPTLADANGGDGAGGEVHAGNESQTLERGKAGPLVTSHPRSPDVAPSCPNCLPYVDLIAGGFPCQPVSTAGRRLIQADDRWLWPEFARCIRELGPRYVLVENVPGLLVGGGMDDVLGDLADLGYDTEWESIPAAAVGAPHLRYRVWIIGTKQSGTVADASSGRGQDDGLRAGRDESGPRSEDVADSLGDGGRRRTAAGGEAAGGRSQRAATRSGDGPRDVAYPDGQRQGRTPALGSPSITGLRPGEAGAEPHGAGYGAMADTNGTGPQGHGSEYRLREGRGEGEAVGSRTSMADTRSGRPSGQGQHVEPCDPEACGHGQATQPIDGGLAGQWSVEPDVGRVAHGVPARVDRLRSLGNAVVPQVVEWIGRRILEAEEMTA